MPWRLKRELVLLVLGALVLALAVVVFVLNRDASTDVLAGVALLGGLAILINALPDRSNGNGHSGPSS